MSVEGRLSTVEAEVRELRGELKHIRDNHLKNLSRVALYELRGRETLLPDLKTKFEQLEEQMKNYTINDSYEIELVESFRTAKTQDGYYAKGRTADGNIITNAEGIAV